MLGAGPVGLSCVALARNSGAAKVLCIGAPMHRLEIAHKMGATDCLDISDTDEAQRANWIRSHTDGRGCDVTIEATGAPIAVAQALRWTRDAGRVTVVGQYTDHGEVGINPHTELNQKASANTRRMGQRTIRTFIAASSCCAMTEWPRHTAISPAESIRCPEANEALADVAKGKKRQGANRRRIEQTCAIMQCSGLRPHRPTLRRSYDANSRNRGAL